MITHLLAATDTPGELGTIANLEQAARLKLKFVDGHDKALADALGEPLPGAVKMSSRYQGQARVIVPTVRTHVAEGENLTLKIILLDKQPVKNAVLYRRALGNGTYSKSDLTHVARAVYRAEISRATEDFEYYIEAQTADGGRLVWPATAPAIAQTVVVCGALPKE